MNAFRLITQSLRHYRSAHFGTAAGLAIATAVICGALIIGTSLKQSLLHIVDLRMGQTTHSVTAGERVFTKTFADRLRTIGAFPAAPVLKTEAVASAQGGQFRVNEVQVWGIDSMFAPVTGTPAGSFSAGDGQILISQNLAVRLMVDTGDYVQLGMKHIGLIPSNTPFVSEEQQTIGRRVQIRGILSEENLSHFNLKTSQSAPYNVFVDIDWLNHIMDMEGRANMVLFRSDGIHSEEALHQHVQQAWQPEDGNLSLRYLEISKQWMLTSERVFIEDYLSETIKEVIPDTEPILTYFVNHFSKDGKETPYSFVGALPETSIRIKSGETIVTRWLADDLQLQPGDSLYMSYYEVGPLRELTERQAGFRVAGIISMEAARQYQELMPHIPGLSDAGNCRDWETGIPIKLESIRQKDEAYWDTYKGTPKAYISLDMGQHLWANRFGKLTAMLIPAEHHEAHQIRELISRHTDPSRLSFRINHVREQGIEAASGGVDFSQLFAGLGVFIILSGLLLTGLLLNYSLKKRQKQIVLLASLGFPGKLITKILLTETLIVTAAGTLAGLLLSIVYSKLILSGLNHLWYDIVRTEALQLHFHVFPLAAGVLVSFLLGATVTGLGIRKIIYRSLAEPGETKTTSGSRKPSVIFPLLSLLLIAGSALLLIVPAVNSQGPGMFHWFASGLCLLIAIISGIYYFLHTKTESFHARITLLRLSQKNLMRNPGRSFIIIVLLALGSFVIVVTASSWKDHMRDPADPSAGTGGFLFIAESTVPLLRNLNHEDTRLEMGLPDNTRFVQLFSAYDDDASCLNLNMVANPRLLAVEPSDLEGRFSFSVRHPWLDRDKPWQSLNRSEGNIIAGIADQTVIQWGLGKKVGDTLYYVNAQGEEVRVLLIGGLENSVFQGNVIVSADNLRKHFPASGGSPVILIDAPAEARQELKEELTFIFRDYGWDMQDTREKLAEFNSVQNTYLRIFFLMGAFGMLIGILGLAVIIAKSLLERNSETAILRASGFRFNTILRLYMTEYIMLFLTGICSGSLAGILSILPNFISGQQNVSPAFLLITMSILILNGMLWMLIVSSLQIKKQVLTQALRND